MNRFLSKIYNQLSIDRLIALLGCGPFQQKLNDAIDVFYKGDKNDASNVKRLRKDIKHSCARYRINPSEYFLFGFDVNSNQCYRNSFVSDKLMINTCLKLTGYDKFTNELSDKWSFYKLTAPYFKREAMLVDGNTELNTFVDFALRNKALFAKPLNASRGDGALVFDVNNHDEAEKTYEKLHNSNSRYIVECKIIQHPLMAEWNESSVNTVRVPAFLNKNGFYVVPPFLRIGRKGAIVDNAGAGGVYANIDPETGVIYTKGFDEYGNYYDIHPDSRIKFEGYQMPLWKELLAKVEEVHRKCMPSHIYIGWDFALTENGWVLIEGNWGQLVNQYVDKVGLKEKFLKYMYGDSINK